jgi:hypothetical protein
MCIDKGIGFVKCSWCMVADKRKVRLKDCEMCGKIVKLDSYLKGMKK